MKIPNRRLHNMIDKEITGKQWNRLHYWMDKPSETLKEKHRMVNHDMKSAVIAGFLFGKKNDDGTRSFDPEAFEAAILHQAVDGIVTELISPIIKAAKGIKKKKK